MRDPVSYAFNPLADNAAEKMESIIEDYKEKSSKGYTVDAHKTYRPLKTELSWMKEFAENGFEKNFLNIHHFNGIIFMGATESPLHETVRDVEELIKQKDEPANEANQDNVVPIAALA